MRHNVAATLFAVLTVRAQTHKAPQVGPHFQVVFTQSILL